MAITQQKLTILFQEAFQGDSVAIHDLAGDGDHYAVTVVSRRFLNLSRVQRHQLVYRALGDKIGSELHALSICALTPNEKENQP
jgi:stress-induced morphogen